ncbi:unnamed protein product [Candida verbasci]|uniref:PQ-loop-domain-containing protein n=1 Tax=Candida verbasci TaxID=1227364 RepID=A0A9W4TXH5_9ASCO|nr:unnamed protein product [Candida verbasci]
MPPPPFPFIIDAQALSGITGSISISCWIIVFAPQIYENFQRKSSDGLSLTFIILWLLGDIFNVLGAIIQGLLPTMIILAIYYTFADIILLYQCLIYKNGPKEEIKYEHLSPANPLNEENTLEVRDNNSSILINSLMVFLVILSGIIGYAITGKDENKGNELILDPLAQFFGWLCALLYLGSRIPQIILNFKRKSCEGISFMFFLFACLGNLTYVISILSIDMSYSYLLVNSSWLAGSLGTLGLDFTIFLQFFMYNKDDIYCDSICDTESDIESVNNRDEGSLLVNGNQRQYGTN